MNPRPTNSVGLTGLTQLTKPATAHTNTPKRAESVMDAIKALILEQGLRPGDSLPTEATLCEQLGVSRSSVREAIRKLEALNIVSVEHGRGSFVGSLSLDPLVQSLAFRSTLLSNEGFEGLRDVVEVRRYLDLGCSEQVVKTLKGTKQPELRRLVGEMQVLASEGKTFEQQDIAYHLGLLAQLPNTVIKQLAHSLWLVHMAVTPQLGLEITHHLRQTADAHELMLNAAIAGDLEAYRDAVTEHYRPLEEILSARI
ncbi:FadR/GntR family transcriptional regulator [Boudabousia marimammalium]|nr:GntR family transcriptional regulator [Boudabousia marimammalium]